MYIDIYENNDVKNQDIQCLSPAMNTTIIVALIATFTAIITAIITDFLNKRSKLKFEERKLKEQYYLEFVHALSENMNNSDSDEAVIRYVMKKVPVPGKKV